MALHPDIIIDIGDVEPEYAELADQIQARTHIPYILLDGRLSHTAETYRLLGKLLGTPAEAEALAVYAGQILTRWNDASDQSRPRVYYARGGDGFSTGADKSLTGEFLAYAGALDVASGTESQMKTSIDQIHQWKPDYIVALSPAAYRAVTTGAAWATLDAVKAGRVLLAPQAPFGWIDEPPSINRLLGIQWLAAKILPQDGLTDVRSIARDFFVRFYHLRPSDAQLAAIMAGSH
jgi:iron complex transport system substrate-binding protein